MSKIWLEFLSFMLVMFYHHLGTQHAVGPLCQKIMSQTSSTIPEVRNISECHQRTTEPQATCAKNSVKFSHVVFELSGQTEKRTFVAILRIPFRGKVMWKSGDWYTAGSSWISCHDGHSSSVVSPCHGDDWYRRWI